MGKKDKYMPNQIAGLTRFKDEGDGIIKFKPEHVIVMTVLVIVMEMFLHKFGHVLF